MISFLKKVSRWQFYIITFYTQVLIFLFVYFGGVFIRYSLEINLDFKLQQALICKWEDRTLQISCENENC